MSEKFAIEFNPTGYMMLATENFDPKHCIAGISMPDEAVERLNKFLVAYTINDACNLTVTVKGAKRGPGKWAKTIKDTLVFPYIGIMADDEGHSGLAIPDEHQEQLQHMSGVFAEITVEIALTKGEMQDGAERIAFVKKGDTFTVQMHNTENLTDNDKNMYMAMLELWQNGWAAQMRQDVGLIYAVQHSPIPAKERLLQCPLRDDGWGPNNGDIVFAIDFVRKEVYPQKFDTSDSICVSRLYHGCYFKTEAEAKEKLAGLIADVDDFFAGKPCKLNCERLMAYMPTAKMLIESNDFD